MTSITKVPDSCVYLGAQSEETTPHSPLALTEIGDSLLVFENMKGSRKIFLRALNAAETAEDETLTIALLNRLARASSALRDSVAARKYLMQAEKKSVMHAHQLWQQIILMVELMN